MDTRITDYRKAIRVVLSVQNMDHYAAAKVYVNLWFKKYSVFTKGYRTIDSEGTKQYEYLKALLSMKRKSILAYHD